LDQVNNPRSIGEAVSVDAWRSPFSRGEGVADIFVDVAFGVALMGGDDAPVRFRAALRGATVHINMGATGVLSVLSNTVVREYSPAQDHTVVKTVRSTQARSTKEGATLKGGAKAGPLGASLDATATVTQEQGGEAKVTSAEEHSYSETRHSMRVQHRKTPTGYAFDIKSANGAPLSGLPWDPQLRRLSIMDGNMYRKVGEPPEPLIEVLVRREDIEIYDVEYTSNKARFKSLNRNKQVIAIQYLKDVIMKTGLYIGDIDDPYSFIKIADVSPSEVRA